MLLQNSVACSLGYRWVDEEAGIGSCIASWICCCCQSCRQTVNDKRMLLNQHELHMDLQQLLPASEHKQAGKVEAQSCAHEAALYGPSCGMQHICTPLHYSKWQLHPASAAAPMQHSTPPTSSCLSLSQVSTCCVKWKQNQL